MGITVTGFTSREVGSEVKSWGGKEGWTQERLRGNPDGEGVSGLVYSGLLWIDLA